MSFFKVFPYIGYFWQYINLTMWTRKLPMWTIIELVFCVCVQDVYSSDKFIQLGETGKKMTLTCPSLCQIRLDKANYLYSDVSDNTTCITSDPTCMQQAYEVTEMCDGSSTCEFYIRQERMTSSQNTSQCSDVTSHYLCVTGLCECADCPDLPRIEHSETAYTSRGAQRTVAYYCKGRFELTGTPVRECNLTSNWTGTPPVCSVPRSICQESEHDVRSFGVECFEFVKRVHNYFAAHDYCVEKGGSLANLRNQSRMETFFMDKFAELNFYGYVWTSNESYESNDCSEYYTNKTSWVYRASDCSYKNYFICKYSISEEIIADLEENANLSKEQQIILWVGVALGILLVLVIILVVIMVYRCRKRRKPIGLPKIIIEELAVTPPPPRRVSSEMRESSEIYYSTVTTPSPRGKSSSAKHRHTYENLTLHNLIGSIKRRIQMTKRSSDPQGDHVDTTEMAPSSPRPLSAHEDAVTAGGRRSVPVDNHKPPTGREAGDNLKNSRLSLQENHKSASNNRSSQKPDSAPAIRRITAQYSVVTPKSQRTASKLEDEEASKDAQQDSPVATLDLGPETEPEYGNSVVANLNTHDVDYGDGHVSFIENDIYDT